MWNYNGSTKIRFVICLILLLHTASLKFPILSKFTNSLQSALFSSNKRQSNPNIGIPTRNAGSIQPAVDVGSRRRKVGPPDRSGKYNVAREEVLAAGRVSVYCIGAGLDLVALKAHVFRRGVKETVKIYAEGKDLEVKNSILRSIPEADETDEMLHVSNFPFYMPAENENSQSNCDIIDHDNEPSSAQGSDSDSTLGTYIRICVNIIICVYAQLHVFVNVRTHLDTYVYICMYTCICTCIHIHIHTYISIHTNYMYIYTCIYT
jgi:hypothetical protein